jgi:hypothetical protein
MSPYHSVGVLPAASIPTTETRTVAVNTHGATKMRLIHETLSRARMRWPQADVTTSAEASRPARQIAMQAHNRAAREQGILQ